MSDATTRNQEIELLVARYLADPRPDLRDLIIVHCNEMVERIARRFAGVEPMDDLAQVGYIGLLNALSKFKQDAGVQFSTYATHLIAGEIKHYLRDRSQTIRQPAWLQEMRQKVNRAVAGLRAEQTEEPTVEQIADRAQVSQDAVREVFSTQELIRVGSLDTSHQDDDGFESDLDRIEDYQADMRQLSFEEQMVLETAMTELRDLERNVLIMFHFQSVSQAEIARELGISCNYVSHVLRQSLNKLRRLLAETELEEQRIREAESPTGPSFDTEIGVFSEGYLHNRLSEEIHRSSAHDWPVAVLRIEFEGLRTLRTFYGEASVKEFLAGAASFLQSQIRRNDILCRHGDYGFGVILPSTGETAAVLEARLTEKASQWMPGQGSAQATVRMLTSFAFYPEDGIGAQGLLSAANAALREITPGYEPKAA